MPEATSILGVRLRHSPPRKMRPDAVSRQTVPLPALAKPGKNAYTKREPRFLRQTETGAGTARFAPPCTATVTGLYFTTRPILTGPGQLLHGVRRQEEDKGHSDKQDENTSPHGGALLFPFAPCRRSGLEGSRARMILYESSVGSNRIVGGVPAPGYSLHVALYMSFLSAGVSLSHHQAACRTRILTSPPAATLRNER